MLGRCQTTHRMPCAWLQFEFSLEEAESGRPDARTTVMIRNIPNKYTQAVMQEVLHKSGFRWGRGRQALLRGCVEWARP